MSLPKGRTPLPVCIPVTMARNLIDEIEAVYARIPKVDCQKKCHPYCGTIPMSGAELSRLSIAFGRTPRKINEADGRCPILTVGGQCGSYEERPLICRLWGAVVDLTCPYGCKAERLLSKDEAQELITAIQTINLLGGVGIPYQMI